MKKAGYSAFLVLMVVLATGCNQEPLQETAPPEQPPAAPVRHVDLKGQSNFRDLGGYQTTDGRTVKWGQVYRSGELPRLSDDDVAHLETLEIETVVSFLTEKEIEARGPDRLPEGVNEVSLAMEAGNLSDLTAVVTQARR